MLGYTEGGLTGGARQQKEDGPFKKIKNEEVRRGPYMASSEGMKTARDTYVLPWTTSEWGSDHRNHH